MTALMATAPRDVERFLERTARQVDRALERCLPKPEGGLSRLHEAQRYAVFGGGKRLRPALAFAACEALGGATRDALPSACAIELIHTYSLVHDDLPAMDDDDFRRGRPSCHKAYDEATAILAGDGLQALAFEVLATRTNDRPLAAALAAELASAAGSRGMVGGQALDLESSPRSGARRLAEIHLLKTAALFRVAARMGARSAEASPDRVDRLGNFGANLGLAFQIVDDILDVCGSAEQLGKTPGKDRRQDKATYPALYGLESSRRRATRLIEIAKEAVAFLGPRARRLNALADFILSRSH